MMNGPRRKAASPITGSDAATAKSGTVAMSRRPRYKNNYLSKVIAKVDFEPRKKLLTKHPPTAISRILKKSFPFRELGTIRQQHIEVKQEDPNTSQTKTTHTTEYQWVFEDKKRERRIELNETNMAIVLKKYISYEQLIDEFMPVVDKYLQPADTHVTRVGLRYVNTFDFDDASPPTDWDKYFTPHIVASFKLATDVKTVSRAFNVLEFNYGDEMAMRFQYGAPNPDYPARIKQRLFVLDWDAYCNLELTRDDVRTYFDRFHDKISASFEEVITDTLRDKMGRLP